MLENLIELFPEINVLIIKINSYLEALNVKSISNGQSTNYDLRPVVRSKMLFPRIHRNSRRRVRLQMMITFLRPENN